MMSTETSKLQPVKELVDDYRDQSHELIQAPRVSRDLDLFHTRRRMLAGYILNAFMISCASTGGEGTPQDPTYGGKLVPPIYKASDYENVRAYCTTCRVEFESEAPEERPAGSVSFEVAGQDPGGVLHVALRMYGVPDELFFVRGTLEIVREPGLGTIRMPLGYRGYRPGGVFTPSGKRRCADVNGTLSSFIRFVGAMCDPAGVASWTGPPRGDVEDLFMLSFNLVGEGDVRIRTTEVLLGVCEAGCGQAEFLPVQRSMLYGGILRVRKR